MIPNPEIQPMTAQITPAQTSPNQHVAHLISAKLAGDGLIVAAKCAEVEKKIAAGTATEEDWRLWVDLPLLAKESKK